MVLFANRVKPKRFALSIVLTALSYPVGILLFTFSVVWLADGIFKQQLSVPQVLLLAMWSFSPHLFGAFILVPYAGGFIALCLALWSLAIMMTGIYAVSALSLTQALLCLALGWVLWQLLRRGIGWPVAGATRWLRTRAAGGPLVTDREGLEQLFRAEAARVEKEAPSAAVLMTADLLGALGVLLFLLLLSGALAPLETLGWWAGWFGVAPQKQLLTDAQNLPKTAENPAQHYLYFFTRH